MFPVTCPDDRRSRKEGWGAVGTGGLYQDVGGRRGTLCIVLKCHDQSAHPAANTASGLNLREGQRPTQREPPGPGPHGTCAPVIVCV